MRRLVFAFALLLAACAAPPVDQQALRRAASAVVEVCTTPAKGGPANCADGFAISANGLIATTYQAIQGGSKGQVATSAGRRFQIARVLAYDPVKDFAVIQAAATNWSPIKASALLALAPGTEVVACRFGTGCGFSGRIHGRETSSAFTVWSADAAQGRRGGSPVLNGSGIAVGMTLAPDPAGGTRILPIHYIVGSIRQGEKGWGLWEVAQLEQSADRERLAQQSIVQNGTYGDRYGTFRSTAPRNWRTLHAEREVGNEAAGVAPAYEVHMLFVPPGVSVPNVFADVPAGIRVKIALADREHTWVHRTEQELLPAIAYQMISERPGFVRREERMAQLGSLQAGYLDLTGADLRIRGYVVAGARCRVLVDMYSPPNSTEFDEIFERFRAGFEFLTCPEYKD